MELKNEISSAICAETKFNEKEKTYSITLKGILSTQYPSILAKINDLVQKEEEGIGIRNIVQTGPYAGNTLADIYLEAGIQAIADIERSSAYQYENTALLCGYNPFDFIELHAELLPFIYKIIAEDFLNDFDKEKLRSDLKDLVKAWPDVKRNVFREKFDVDIDKVENYIETANELEVQRMASRVREYLEDETRAAAYLIADHKKKICDDQLIEEPDQDAGKLMRELFAPNDWSGFINFLLRNASRKGEPKNRNYERALSNLIIFLQLVKNLLSYPDFLMSFQRLFRLTPDKIVELVSVTPEEQEKDYEEKVRELTERIQKIQNDTAT